MYKWKLKFILKSGKELTAYYNGTEASSFEVIEKILLVGVGDNNTFNSFSNKDKTENIFVKIGEIASVSISAA